MQEDGHVLVVENVTKRERGGGGGGGGGMEGGEGEKLTYFSLSVYINNIVVLILKIHHLASVLI